MALLAAAAEERETALLGHCAADAGVPSSNLSAEAAPAEAQAHAAASPDAATNEGSSPTESTASLASNISDRVQAYVTARIDGLRDEIEARGYITALDAEEQFDLRYVDEETMMEEIGRAIDEHMGRIRDKLFDAWT